MKEPVPATWFLYERLGFRRPAAPSAAPPGAAGVLRPLFIDPFMPYARSVCPETGSASYSATGPSLQAADGSLQGLLDGEEVHRQLLVAGLAQCRGDPSDPTGYLL